MGLIEKIKSLKKPNARWEHFYTKEERKLVVPDKSMYDILEDSAIDYPDYTAYSYFGTKVTYYEMYKEVKKAIDAYRSHGIRRGDVVSLCLPNVPEALISLYALNYIGAIVEMIHPLSSEVEIKNYLNSTGSVMIVMVDFCYEKIKNILPETKVYKSIYVSPKESMPFLMSFGYEITKGFKIEKPDKNDSSCISWSSFIRDGKRYHMSFDSMTKKDDPAVILHSGGTTGIPKSIVLSSGNFNALVEQAKIMLKNVLPGDKILGVLPIFHGFGLGVTMHCAVAKGVEIQLIPQFDAKKFGKILTKDRPNLIMGVPTLFEAMTNVDEKNMDLSYLKYVVCGGDSLNQNLIDKVNKYLKDHNGRIRICQGYGMTECLGAVCVGFKDETNRDLSMGIPLPGDYLKIVDPKTLEEMPVGKPGEICVSGPTVMMGYLDNPKDTNEILRKHPDGHIWLHTGDMGRMTDEGIFYYEQRIKRMIISSGFNVYPNQIESVICEHEAVLNCTVIAIPHPYKQQVAKAFVVLKEGYSDNIFTRNSIKEHCKKHLSKFSLPYEYEFRKSLPKTLIGKVDFKKLQEEEDKKRNKK